MSNAKVVICKQFLSILKEYVFTVIANTKTEMTLISEKNKNTIIMKKVDSIEATKEDLAVFVELPTPEDTIKVNSVITFNEEGESTKIEYVETAALKVCTGRRTPPHAGAHARNPG